MKKNATGQDLGIHANTTKSLLFLFNIETDDGNLAEKFELCYSVIKDLEINDLSRLASHASGVSFVTLDDSNHTSKQLVKSIDDEAYDDIRQDIEHLTLDELFGNTQRCYMLRLKLGKGKFDLNVLSDFVLLWQRYQANMREIYQDDKARHHSKLILSIDGFSNGDYYRVSRFLYLTAQWYRQPPPISEEADSFYDAVYFCEREWDDKKEIGSRRLWRKPKGRHDDLFPLIPVDSNSLNKVLRVSLESVLKEFDTKTANGYQRLKNVLQKSMDSYIKELEKEYKGKLKPIKAEIKKRGSQRSLFDPLGEANTFYKVQLMKLLIVKDLSWLVSGEMNSIQFYYDKVEKLDLLNLLFMTHFRRVLPSNDDVVTLIEYSEAPSAAINQLLENIIYHSEYSEGLFSIRAHTGSDAREGGSDRQLLESEYGEAFLKKMSQNSGDRQAYIDIRIADASSEGVPDTFARNVKDDGMAALNGYFDSCYSFAAHIDKSSILSKAESEDKRTAFWKAYYKAIKGAALHRGLAVFLNSILLAEGTFKARTYLANKQKQSVLEPVGGDGAPKESIVKETQVDKNIKGTRFSVLYPVHVPTRQYSQIIDIDQEDRVDRKKHMVVEVQVSAFYAVQPIQDENEKNKFGEAVYPALRKDINTRIKEHLKQMESEDDERIMTLVISFDNGDRTKNEAVIKHLGRLFFDLAIENFGENKVKLAIRCKYQSEVVMCVESFYFAYEVLMAQEAWPKGIEAFIFDNEGFYQVHWRGTSIQEVFETDGTRTFRFGGDSLLHTILPLSERIESVGQSLKQISSGLSKSSKKGNAVDDKNKIHPFTLVLKVRGLVPNSEITLFEASLKNILHRDIKEPQRQGYRLPRAHMRLGSKIHIEDFYLVDSVFQNGYYVNGFSNLIADDILSKISEDYPSENSQPAILLIGYGGYSELLVEKVRHYLEDSLSEIYCDYCIYDPTLDKRDSDEASAFRRLMGNKVIAERDKLLIAQIVPTNSTLTTFSKMGDKLLRLLYRLKKEIGTSFEPQIKWNYAPIIVRDQQKGSDAEKKFFECDSEDERLLHTKFPVGDRASAGVSGSEQKTPEYKYNVYCYVSVPSVWHLPGECPLCYPEPGFLLEEQPLIETDKASIIPFSQFGKREPIDIPDIKQTLNELKWIESERRLKNSLFKIDQNGFIEPEGNYVEYRHIVRGLNHYQYYLRTDHIFEHLTNRGTKTKTELVNWLEKDIGKAISKDYTGKNAVHFIISPMHSSNAALLNTINRHVFDNKALIVHSEFEKDFKDNFMAKYFYIKNQIDLACKRQSAIQKPYFCFHYVDDILSHNDDFKRVKELLRALIPDSFTTGNQDDKPPEIKIFDRVILLINRFSKSSKYSFVDDPACFHAYLNINISYIRNQKDACILCNTFNDDIEYAERASTVKLANLGYERAYWHRAIEYEDLDTRVYRNGGDGKPYRERNKSYYRLFAAHRAGLLYGVNDETEAGKAIEDMIEETAFSDNNRLLHRNEQGVVESSERFEWIVSFLKVIARPFPVFRDSVRRAVFSHLLTLLNEIIHLPQQYEEIKKPKKFLNRYGITTNAYKQRLMVVLMNRLATLGGNYLLRPEVYHAAKAMWQKLGGDTEWRKMCDEHGHEILDFDLIFLSNCMRVIDTVGDDSKSYRFARDMMERSDQAKPYYSEALDLALYVENTRILREGINELLSVCQRRIREDNREVPEARDLLAFITENLNSNNEELPYFLDYFEEFRSLESKQTATALDNDGHYSMVALMWLTKDSATFLQKSVESYYSGLAKHLRKIAGADEVILYLVRSVLGNRGGETRGDTFEYIPFAWSVNSDMETDSEVPNYRDSKLREDLDWDALTGSWFIAPESDSDRNKRTPKTIYCQFISPLSHENDDEKLTFLSQGLPTVHAAPASLQDKIIVRMRISYKNNGSCQIGGQPFEVGIALRNTLIFRHLLLKTFEHEGNNDYFERLWKNHILANPDSHYHSKEQLRQLLIEGIIKRHNEEGEDREFLSQVLRKIIDEYIGCINMELLSLASPETSTEKASLLYKEELGRKNFFGAFELWRQLDILGGLPNNERFRLLKKEGEMHGTTQELIDSVKKDYKFRENSCKQSYSALIYNVFILRVVMDAIEYSAKTLQDEPATIYIFTEADIVNRDIIWLVFANQADEERLLRVKNTMEDPQMRGNGVSIPAIYEAIDRLYGWPKNRNIIEVYEVYETDEVKQMVKISLPILQRKV